MQSIEKLTSSSIQTISGYNLNKKVLSFCELIELDVPDVNAALNRVISNIQLHWDDIRNIFAEIPNVHDSLDIMSEERKAFYIRGMELRLEKVLLPYVTN